MSRRRGGADEAADDGTFDAIPWFETAVGDDLLACVRRRMSAEELAADDDAYEDALDRIVEADPSLRARMLVAEAIGLEQGAAEADLADDEVVLDEVDALLATALETHPGCTEALLAEALRREETPSARVVALVELLRQAESRLPAGALTGSRGTLHLLDEGAPYLRVRLQLAAALRDDGRAERALRHAIECAALSPDWFAPHDHLLAAWLLEAGRTAEAREALARIPPDLRAQDVTVGWCDVLADVLDGRAEGDAARVAWSAVAAGDPEFASILDPDSEATACGDLEEETGGDPLDPLQATAEAWRRQPAAVAWLRRSGGTAAPAIPL